MAEEMEFDMQPVASTQLDSVGYDEDSKRLRVRFQNQALYEYTGVPESAYTALIQAPSVGQQFNASVKNGYPYRRLE